ncbi:hypothetical protein EDD16DRAFT_1720000 [Pisolithus croceorrhizus]|nr:hypothetical protein EDD16DRAFT_1720000 [Pisolithus croceorrhizus]
MVATLDLDRFSVHKLQSEGGLYDAFEHLNNKLADSHIGNVVSDLLEKPNLFVYVFSVFPNPPSIRNKILGGFPVDSQTLQQSFIPTLLSALSTFFFNLPSDTFHGDESRTVGRYERYVADVWPAMAILSSIAFGTATSGNTMNTSFRARKTIISVHDATILRKLNIPLPSDSHVAMQTLGDIMAVILQILKFYLDLLSDPRFADRCKDVYFGTSDKLDEDSEAEAADVPPLSHSEGPHLEATLATADIDLFGEWTILMASSATKDLFQLRRHDAKMAECVLKKIRQVSPHFIGEGVSHLYIFRQLSRGQFSGNNHKMLHGPSHGIPIYQAEITSNLRLVYQIDCTLDDDGQAERQVVKVYGIYSHKQLDHIWPWLSKLLNGRGKVYRQRCILRERGGPDSGVYRPATFSPTMEETTIKQSPILVREDGRSEDHTWLMSSKCVKLSKAYLNGLIAEREVELPFQLTTKEWQIVQCPTSCYVIGRSGTGKTTAMVFKMLGIQRAWEQVPSFRKPRQLFVTRFPVLAAKVEEFFTSLVESLELAGCTQDELRKLRSQIRSTAQQPPQMIDPLNALSYRPGTPQKYSELSDHDFPFFITFDQLARMVAADIHIGDSKEFGRPIASKEYNRLQFILDKVINDESSFVTSSTFRTHYWPRLCDASRSPLAQKFGPWLIFSEFMGVIKGSETAFHSPNGTLDRQTYVNLSTRTYPVFAGNRHSLYSAFELYSKLKGERYDYDMADRTYAILKALSCNPLKGQPVDYLYVDEVQDNLIIDTILLRILCRNADGLFWAGDTAQTISAGSSFRFADLKALIHRTEAAGNMAIQKSCAQPEVFKLPINYRSHGGIVDCAQLVVKLIADFWPDSIDVLEPERAMLGGPRPVFFTGWQNDISPHESFFSSLKGNRELGAEQCILVRNDTVREQIRKQFGDIAVILTLEASKGLEFDDVFLYNFFEDSATTFSQWRSILVACSDKDVTLSRNTSRSPHSALCTELKNLYVGITRARKKLYFLDHSQNSEPMRELWSKKGLIDIAPSGTNICEYAEESTLEQWAASGNKLFNACQFQEAVRCFERANLPRQLGIAQAYGLREVAASTVQTVERQKAFFDAAEAFAQCAREALPSEETRFRREAAKCYALADKPHIAAKFYIAADDISGAAEQYRKAGRFDEIAQILNRHTEKLAASYRSTLLHLPPVPLFSSAAEELKYLDEKGLHKERIDLLKSLGRILEAAEAQLGFGQLCDAIQTLLEHRDNQPNTMQRAVDIVLDTLWQECSFSMPIQSILRNKGSNAHKVLNCVRDIPLERLKISDSKQIRFFLVVQKSPFSEEVYRLGEEFSGRGDEAMALMAFDVYFSELPALNSASASEIDTFLRRFERYVRLLASTVSDEIPLRATDSRVRRVFGISPSSDYHYSVSAGTFLHRKFAQNQHLTMADTNLLLKGRLKARLRQKVLEENDTSCDSQAFSTQCPYSIMHGRSCSRMIHCHQQHEQKMSLDAAAYNAKVNVHLQQIRILDLMFSAVGSHEDWHASMTTGLHRLYAALYPTIYIEGSIADLDLSTPRNAAGCIGVARKWIQNAIEHLKPTDEPNIYSNYLMNIIRVTCLHTTLGGDYALREYVSHDSCRVSYGEQLLAEDDNVSTDVVASLIGSDPTPGVPALRFLLQNGVGMDLSVVCHFAEEICSRFVSSLHPSGEFSPLHNLLVPRRWIMDPDRPAVRKDTIQHFLYCLRRLMNILRSGRVHTKFDLPTDGESFVDVILARMCRMLCILGYNVRDVGLSKTIAEILLLPPFEVDRTRNESPQILRQLVNLRRQYLETILALDSGSAIKDLIHLVHKNSRYLTRPISPQIPQLIFEEVADISRQMKRAPVF